MNKLLMSDDIIKIDNDNILIEDNNINIEVTGKSKITILNKQINSFNILIKKDSEVMIEDFRIMDKEDTSIKITIEENSILTYNHSFINNEEYNLNIITNYIGNNSKIVFNIHGINDKGISNITADGVLGNNIKNELLENIHIININDGKAIIIPNILADNNEVLANHAATIGRINKEEINYLMSKGISYNLARKLILNGFLINIFKTDELIIKIKEIINWR